MMKILSDYDKKIVIDTRNEDFLVWSTLPIFVLKRVFSTRRINENRNLRHVSSIIMIKKIIYVRRKKIPVTLMEESTYSNIVRQLKYFNPTRSLRRAETNERCPINYNYCYI